MDDLRIVAVDWSGARTPGAQRRGTWIAVVEDGILVESRGGWTREEAVAYVAGIRPPVVAGFDFSFSVPAWFARAHGCASVEDVWMRAADDGEEWLRPTPPFWRTRCAVPPEHRFRRCEERLRAGGAPAKSVFQLVGNGQVGAGSVRGMPLLRRLRDSEFAVWPFDAPGDRTVVEIYPSLLCAGMRPRTDEGDAVGSARVMWEHRASFTELERATDPVTLLEGDVWTPGLSRSCP
jgi:hypothetical protein